MLKSPRRLPSRSARGFTMLELIVVIVILGILAAIAVPTFKGVIDRSKDSSTEATLGLPLRDASALAAFRGVSTPTVADVEAATADLPRSEVLTVNGDMELDADGNGLPDGWSAFTPTSVALSRTTGASGSGYALTSKTTAIPAGSNTPRVMDTVTLDVEVGRTYLATAKVKAPLGTFVYLGAYGYTAAGAGSIYSATTAPATGNWQTLSIPVKSTLPRMRVTPGVQAPGGVSGTVVEGTEFSVDDVTLRATGWGVSAGPANDHVVSVAATADGSTLGVASRPAAGNCVMGRVAGGALTTWRSDAPYASCTGSAALAGR